MSGQERSLSAVDVLRRGGVVAMPTDTVYGLCALASDDEAVARLYEVKARNPRQPLPIFVTSREQAATIAEMDAGADALAARFWPGALTIVLPLKPSFRTRAAAGGQTIGLRVPNDTVLREIAAGLGPITGTSANIAGREECHTASEVRAQLGGTIDLIVDAPVTAMGVPSTIVECTDLRHVRILRDGAVPRGAIVDALAGIATVE